MTKWLLAAAPLAVAAGAAWVHFTGSMNEGPFRVAFLICSAAWFLLALRAQRPDKSE